MHLMEPSVVSNFAANRRRCSPLVFFRLIRPHYHLHESVIKRRSNECASCWSVQSTLPPTTHAFQHSFGTNLLGDDYDLRTAQEPLGHKDVWTTMSKRTYLFVAVEESRVPLIAFAKPSPVRAEQPSSLGGRPNQRARE